MPDLENTTGISAALPLSPPLSGTRPLSEQINSATEEIHSQLNGLILNRLPLALPPYTSNPSIFVTGLLYIASIYITFESLWQNILDTPGPSTRPKHLSQTGASDSTRVVLRPDGPNLTAVNNWTSLGSSDVRSRDYSLLSHFQLTGLLRSGRLRADIKALTSTSDDDIEDHLAAVSRRDTPASFIAHMKRSVDAKPYVLLAYAWVMYMALFAGGRYLRVMLKDANGLGNDFWDREPSPIRPYLVKNHDDHHPSSPKAGALGSTEPIATVGANSLQIDNGSKKLFDLEFFNFIGDEDGEDIKLDFKRRFADAEQLLTTIEREDIILEAHKLYKYIVDIVMELDGVIGTNQENS